MVDTQSPRGLTAALHLGAPPPDALELARIVARTQARLVGGARPAQVGRYELGAWLGAGAFGVVYAAYDPLMQRAVAVKVLRPTAAGGNLDDAIRREAQAQARVSHPHVVPILDVGQHESRSFVVMAQLEGDDLGAWSRAAARSTAEILAAIVQAGRGLAAAHAAGLVHCDVKPSNILRTTTGTVQIGDFGVATAARRRGLGGTRQYMAPEQHDGLPVDPRTDQWALAWVAMELLTKAVDGIPRAIGAALARALASDPNDRFSTMADFVGALERAARSARRRRWVIGLGVSAVVLVAVTATSLQALGEDRGPRATSVLSGLSALEPSSDHARAEARYLRAKTAMERGATEEAITDFEAAHDLAVAGDHMQIAVESALNLSGWAADRGDVETARRWLSSANAAVDRAGRPAELDAAWWTTAMGIEMVQGNLEDAVTAGRRAVARWRSVTPIPVERLITAQRGLAIALLRGERPTEAASIARDAVDIAAETWGIDDHRRAHSLDVLAAALSESGRPEEALQQGEEAVRIVRLHYGDDHPATTQVRLNLAEHQLATGRTQEAISTLDSLAKRLDDDTKVLRPKVELLLGRALIRAGRRDAARDHLVRAIVDFEADGPQDSGSLEQARAELKRLDAAPG